MRNRYARLCVQGQTLVPPKGAESDCVTRDTLEVPPEDGSGKVRTIARQGEKVLTLYSVDLKVDFTLLRVAKDLDEVFGIANEVVGDLSVDLLGSHSTFPFFLPLA